MHCSPEKIRASHYVGAGVVILPAGMITEARRFKEKKSVSTVIADYFLDLFLCLIVDPMPHALYPEPCGIRQLCVCVMTET